MEQGSGKGLRVSGSKDVRVLTLGRRLGTEGGLSRQRRGRAKPYLESLVKGSWARRKTSVQKIGWLWRIRNFMLVCCLTAVVPLLSAQTPSDWNDGLSESQKGCLGHFRPYRQGFSCREEHRPIPKPVLLAPHSSLKLLGKSDCKCILCIFFDYFPFRHSSH